ncbi:hypothetical protein BB558_001037 [Smittium angustum]|uniref:Importin N-terminal domain-containing protein n=1 Tax=Smittium angustum TaxID=133377 RepID=A0A2U1JCQ8_SMIAN|nr:hypothetical protein BB558_001037 [Smittium angustum]
MELQCYENIKLTLDPNLEIRIQAEENLQKFQTNPDFSIAIAKVCVANDVAEDIRQASLLYLKSYIDSHWNMGCEKYTTGSVASQESKQIVREMIFGILSDKTSKIRKAAAYVLSAIGKYDWPDEWPQMFQLLLNLLKSGDNNQISSSLAVFKEIIRRDLSSDQLNELFLLLPELKNILDRSQIHSIETQTSAVLIFEESIEFLSLSGLENTGIDKKTVKYMIASWIEKFFEILYTKITPQTIDLIALKYAVVKSLNKISLAFSKNYNEFYQAGFVAVWSQLKESLPEYESQYIFSENSDGFNEPWVASFRYDDNTIVDLSSYISMLLEYMVVACRQRSAKKVLEIENTGKDNTYSNIMAEIIVNCMAYMQISVEMSESWISDIDLFISEEEESGILYSVRQASRDLLQTLCEQFLDDYVKAFQVAFFHRINMSFPTAALKENGIEAALYALEISSNEFNSIQHPPDPSKANSIDIQEVTKNVVIPSILNSSTPFLIGRAFLVSSVYSRLLTRDLVDNLLKAAIDPSKVHSQENIHQQQFKHPIVQVSTLRACTKFCNLVPLDVIKGYLPEIIIKAANLAGNLSHESLFIILGCILAALKVDQSILEYIEPTIGPLIVETWSRFGHDPVLESLLADLVTELSKTQRSFIMIFSRFLPTLVATFEQNNLDKIPSAIELLAGIIRGGGKTTLPDGCIEAIFPLLMSVLLTSNDSAVMQNGQECLKYMVQNGLQQIIDYKNNAENTTGLQLLFKFIEEILGPDASESNGLFIGDLITKIIIKNEKINSVTGDDLTKLIYLVTKKLSVSRSSVFAASLLPTICLLFARSPLETVNLLNGFEVTNIGGEEITGLKSFLEKWVEYAPDIQGVYFTKISTAAMINVLLLNDARVNSVIVKGDPIETQTDNIKFSLRSRSKSVAIVYTQIPASIKLIKLLLDEYSNDLDNLNIQGYEGIKRRALGAALGMNQKESAFASSMIDDYENPMSLYSQYSNFDKSLDYQDDDDDDDPDIINDPIYTQDMSIRIKEFIKQCVLVNSGFVSTISGYLSQNEKDILGMIIKSP